MKKNFGRKIAAIAFAGIVTFGMSATAFAAEGDVATTQTVSDSVTLKKAIQVTNYDGYAYEPTITYSYTLNGVEAGGTVSDGTTTVTFKAGSTNYLAEGSTAVQTAVFSSDKTATSGSSAVRDLKWTFDPAKFPSAGVYRYEISETTDKDPESIGIVRPEKYDTSKYLNVYVQNGTDGLEIYGYTLVDDDGNVTKESAKSQGWGTDETGSDPSVQDPDLETYKTYNITITNKISGTGADMTAKFPYTVQLSGEMSSANIAVNTVAANTSEGTTDTAVTITEGSEGTSDSATVNKDLGADETLIIKGLPTTVSYSINEANTTPDAYTANIAEVAGTTSVTTTDNADFNLAAGNGVFGVANNVPVLGSTAAIAITVNNALGIISPTGVVMRFAPYLFILGAAIFLIMFNRRRTAEEEEE